MVEEQSPQQQSQAPPFLSRDDAHALALAVSLLDMPADKESQEFEEGYEEAKRLVIALLWSAAGGDRP